MSNYMLNDFVAQVKSGIAKQSHFLVQLTPPPALSNFGGIKEGMNKIILFCDQAQLPGLSFGTNQVRSYGEFKEVPYEKLFEPINLSFYVDTSLSVKMLFDKWVELVQSPVTRDFSYPSTYLTDKIDIIVLDTQNRSRYMVSLHKVFPKAIAPIQLDYGSKEIMKLQVTLSYQYATTKQLSNTTSSNEEEVLTLNAAMPKYNYGWDALTEVPKDYFNDFAGFQNAASNYDFSFEGVKSYATVENIGEITGFGSIFT